MTNRQDRPRGTTLLSPFRPSRRDKNRIGSRNSVSFAQRLILVVVVVVLVVRRRVFRKTVVGEVAGVEDDGV